MQRIALIIAAVALWTAPAYAQRAIVKGSVDQTTYIRIVDSADGTPETGVVAATSGLDLEYVRLGATPTDLTESDLGAANSAHADGGIFHVGGGMYRVDMPDAAVATGVNEVMVQGTVTGMIVIPVRHALVDVNPYDTVRMGLTALPNVASGSAGAIITSGTGTAQLSVTSGRAAADVTHWLGTAAATPTIAGVPEVDVTHYGGTAGSFGAGLPTVNVGKIDGVDPITVLDSSAAAGADGVVTGYRLHQLITFDSDIDGAAPPAVGSVFHELMSKTTGSFTFDQTTDSNEALRDNVGTAGVGLTAADDATITAIGALNNLSQANVRTAVGLASANLDTQLSTIDGILDNIATAYELDGSVYRLTVNALELAPTGSGGTNINQIEGTDATDVIDARVAAMLEAIHLDHLLAADYNPASKPGVATALLNELIESDGGVSQFTANALEEAPAGGGGGGTAATRDLEPPQFVWTLNRRADGTVRATNPLRIQPGETIVAGFDCKTGFVLPQGAVIAEMEDPTGLSGELSATTKGTNGQYVNVSITASGAATDGTTQTVAVEVTNSFGDGPMILRAQVIVVEDD